MKNTIFIYFIEGITNILSTMEVLQENKGAQEAMALRISFTFNLTIQI